MSCYYSSSRASAAANDARAAKDNAERAVRETKKLKEQFDKIQKDQAKVLENQKALLTQFADIAAAVQQMREEMYPSVKSTKPALKKPQHKR